MRPASPPSSSTACTRSGATDPTGPRPARHPADKELNKGAVFFDDFAGTVEREVPSYAGATVNTETGALETTPPDYDRLELGSFPEGVLHKFDYAFWYRNLQDNVALRVDRYLSTPPAEATD